MVVSMANWLPPQGGKPFAIDTSVVDAMDGGNVEI